jgi:hypothetical protein
LAAIFIVSILVFSTDRVIDLPLEPLAAVERGRARSTGEHVTGHA